MNILVFKTSVETKDHMTHLTPILDSLVGHGAWNFDLSDCDRILRIASDKVSAEAAAHLLSGFGFLCHELED